MRLVTKNQKDKPAILISQATLDTLDDLIRNGDPAAIREDLYQDSYKDAEGKRQMRVRDELNKYYLHKCAYCETDCKAEIEHYRPKKRVTGVAFNSGYYWLCYEWSNLLPSCHDCNTAGGKSNQFPVKGIRVANPPLLANGNLDTSQVKADVSPLVDEHPYLLHPELDDPSLFLGVEIDLKGEGLQLYGLDGANQRGEQTIRICNLNRKNLKINRLRTLNAFIKGINVVFGLLAAGHLEQQYLERALQIQFEQMDSDIQNNRLEHTLLRRFAIATVGRFSALVLPLLEPAQRQIVRAAFIEHRQNNPL
ncbi:hypothetical protein VF13_38775 [Nostoc linckia z16]|nr:hypothetical protein VF13_38775 [Nostoc linckia z16]